MAPETASGPEALTANAFTNAGYVFAGWSTSASGSVIYANGATYPFDASATLYAQWTTNSAPTITAEPTDQTVALNSTATFTAEASGSPSPTVQWQVSTNAGSTWSPIAGATSDTYAVVAETTGYEYEAVFTNTVGSITSSPAQLEALGYSSNWAGYILTNSTFSSVSGSWTVPTVSCTASEDVYAAEWVGIDGYEENDNYVIQDGTSTDCNGTEPVYNAWYEFYGNDSVNDGYEVEIPTGEYPVAPGNVMAASVTYASDAWTFTLSDSTAHWTFTTTVTNASPPPPQSSAEWIVEAPQVCDGSCGQSSLADFGVVHFTNAAATADGTTTTLVTSSGIAEVDGNGAPGTDPYMSPGPLSDDGSAFAVTWESS